VRQGRRRERNRRGRGLASEQAKETGWLGVAVATEQKRGRDKARPQGYCGDGRNSGVRCWQPVGNVALGGGCQRQRARAVRG
jgi:hypothetical protein